MTAAALLARGGGGDDKAGCDQGKRIPMRIAGGVNMFARPSQAIAVADDAGVRLHDSAQALAGIVRQRRRRRWRAKPAGRPRGFFTQALGDAMREHDGLQ